jgi:plastocyanin
MIFCGIRRHYVQAFGRRHTDKEGKGVPRAMRHAINIITLVSALLLLTAAAPLAHGPTSAKPPKAETVKVTIQKMKFSPAAVSVRAGDTVTWTNNDQHDHTVDAADGSFTSGTISPGETFSRQFTKAAAVPYTCTLHPRMRGTVTVK